MTEEVRFRNPVQALGYSALYNAIIDDTRLSGEELRLLLQYMKYAQGKGSCFPSVELLAKKVGKTERTIVRYNAKLERLGYITRERRSDTTSVTVIEDPAYISELTALARLELERRTQMSCAETPTGHECPVEEATGHGCPVEETLSDSIQTSVSFPSEKKQSAAPTAEVEYVDLEAEDLHEEKLRLARLAGDGVPAPDLGKRPRVKAHPKRKVTEHTRMVRALQQAFKFPGKMTQSQRGRLNKLAPLILMNGYTLEQVRDVGSIWWTTWPGNEGSPPSNDQFLQRLEQDSQRRAKTRVFTS